MFSLSHLVSGAFERRKHTWRVGACAGSAQDRPRCTFESWGVGGSCTFESWGVGGSKSDPDPEELRLRDFIWRMPARRRYRYFAFIWTRTARAKSVFVSGRGCSPSKGEETVFDFPSACNGLQVGQD